MKKESEMMTPLLVSRGKYLNELRLKSSDIEYIRDKETARTIYSLNLITEDEVLEMFRRKAVNQGYIYWLFTSKFDFSSLCDPKAGDYSILSMISHSVAKSHNTDLVKHIYSRKEKYFLKLDLERVSAYDRFIYSSINCMVKEGFKEGVDYMLRYFSMTEKHLEDLLWTAMTNESIDVFSLLWNSLDRSSQFIIDNIFSKDTLTINCNPTFMKHILSDPKLQKEISINKWYILGLIQGYGSRKSLTNVLSLLLNFTKISDEEGYCISECIKRGCKEIAQLLLQNGFPILDIHIIAAVKENRIDLLHLFHQYEPNKFLILMKELVSIAINRQFSNILRFLLEIPGVNRRINSNILKKAEEIVAKE